MWFNFMKPYFVNLRNEDRMLMGYLLPLLGMMSEFSWKDGLRRK